ncbi:hypothetical protein Csa_015870 [Cucumis sativus]|uniref:Uncharacterized protein n=1 Tax=Cucumis sativus TaxID=3659 RepID=A0A0A0K375_CUCSA|nr:hypothetical protein Csa_015870 [Cucumis sativus]
MTWLSVVHVESSNNDFSDNGSAFNMMSWDYDVDVNVEAFEVPEVDCVYTVTSWLASYAEPICHVYEWKTTEGFIDKVILPLRIVGQVDCCKKV